MAAEIKIDIKANAQDAIQQLEKLGSAFDGQATSLSKARSELIKASGDITKSSKEWLAYQNAVNRVSSGYKAIETEGVAAKKSINLINSELQKLVTNGASVDKIKLFSDDMDSIYQENVKILDELNKKREEEKRIVEEARIAEESYKIEMEELLGNALPKLNKELKEKEEQLLKLVKTEGASAESTKKLAQEVGTLREKIKNAERQTTSFSVKTKNLMTSFVSAQVIVSLVSRAFHAIVNTIKESAEAASEAEETFNLFISTFDEVENKAVRTANTMASAFGTASSTMQKALGTFGDLISGYGGSDRQALEFAEKAASTVMDIISYKNISGNLDEIYSSFASGLAGNVENFRKLGYVMTQAEVNSRLAKKGMDGLTGSSLQLAQVQERLNILMEKSKNAQGDMLKTLNSTENINRRISEAWKEYKADLGQNINKVFNPIKQWWLEILDATNKANDAKKEFLKTDSAAVEQIYSMDNAKDRRNFGIAVRRIGISDGNSLEQNVEDALKTIQLYGASLEDFVSAMDVFEGSYSYFDSYAIKQYVEAVTKEIETTKYLAHVMEEQEDRYSTLLEKQSQINSFIDNLSSIRGLNVSSLNYPKNLLRNAAKTEGYTTYYSSLMDNAESARIEAIIKQLANNSLESFSPAIETLLGTLNESDMLQNQLEIVKKVFEAVYNNAVSNSITASNGDLITDEERKQLDDIAKIFNDIAVKLDEIAKEEQRITKFNNALSSLNNNVNSFSSQMALNSILSAIEVPEFLLGNEKTRATDIFNAEQSRAEALALAKTEQEINEVNKAFEDLVSIINDVYDAEAENLRLTELTNSVKSINSNASSLSSQLALDRIVNSILGPEHLRATEQARARDIYQAQEDAVNAMVFANTDDEFAALESALNEQINKINELYDAEIERISKETIQSTFLDPLGQTGDFIKLGMGSLDPMTFGLNVFTELASQIEVVAQAASILTDSVLPVLNAFLEPISEVLTEITDIVQNLLVEVLDPFWALFKTVFESVSSILSDVFDFLLPIINDILEPLASILDPIAVILNVIISLVQPLLGLLSPIAGIFKVFSLILEPLKPILQAVAKIFIELGAGITYVKTIIGNFVGTVVKAFLDMVNGIIDILNKIPFVYIKKADTSKWEDMKNKNADEETRRYREEMRKSLESIEEATFSIDKNTGKDNMDLINQIKDLYNKGLIDQATYKGQLSKLTDKKYDASNAFSAGGVYWQTGNGAYYSKGAVNININGDNLNSDEIAKKVAEILSNSSRPGAMSYGVGVYT